MKEQQQQVGWQASEPFYESLFKRIDECAESYKHINESEEYVNICKFLEDWYESTDLIYIYINGFLSETEREHFQTKYRDIIEDITGGAMFRQAGLTSNELTIIKATVKKYTEELFIFMAKKGFLLPTEERKTYNSIFDQAEDEGV